MALASESINEYIPVLSTPMFPIAKCINDLLAALPPYPMPQQTLDELVETAINASKQHSSSENRRGQWELLLRNEVYKVADLEGTFEEEPDMSYYTALCDRLDVILTFTEHDACEPTFPFTVLQDLLETQTVTSCSHIFSWIEQRSDRLTEGMVPQKGKALVLLRTLNDLLRRLSKTGKTTSFCGRILTFLSAVFPLGERSGVNLRGEYGPQWDPVTYRKVVVEEKMEVDQVREGADTEIPSEGVTTSAKDIEMEEDKEVTQSKSKNHLERTEDEKKEEFYNTFWSLQLPFSRPLLFSVPDTMETFKSAVNTVMPVIKEATVKERAMMGSKIVVGTLKRKREESPTSNLDDRSRNYFFAKFLTSPDLLDLEIADTSFRRQFLFQLLILLHHLLLFTKTEKAIWATPRNRSLQMDFVLQPDDAKWVQDMITRSYEELRHTAPNGRAFAETVQIILEREKNWVKWKNELCSPFDKEPLSESLEESTEAARAKLRADMEEYKHKLGSAALTEIWAMGYRDLNDLQNPFIPGDVKDFVKDIEKENARIKMRRQQIEKQQQQARARAAATKPTTPAPVPPSGGTPPPTAGVAHSLPAPIAQRPSSVQPPVASSPPLHPSLPAKPGTVTLPLLTHSPAQLSPVQTPVPVASQAGTTPTPVVRPLELSDPLIKKAEENKERMSWLALRTARDAYLHHFGRIGNGDVVLLAREIEKEKERLQREDSQPAPIEGLSDAVANSFVPSIPISEIQSESIVQTTSEERLPVPIDEVHAEQKADVSDVMMEGSNTQAQPTRAADAPAQTP